MCGKTSDRAKQTWKRRAMALAVATSVMAIGASHASAQGVYVDRQPRNFFEVLFPELIDQRIQRTAPPAPVETVKISPPKYYSYKPDALVEIDLAALVPVPATDEQETEPRAEPAAFETGDDGPSISELDPALSNEATAEPTAFDRIAVHFQELSVMAEPDIAEAVKAHYANNPEPMWLDDDLRPNARARSILPILRDAGRYGLEPSDYAVALPIEGDAEAAARFEIAVTARAVRYGIDASYGRVDPNKLSGYHDLPRPDDMAGIVLKKLSGGALPAPVLEGMHPGNAPYKALVAELARVSSVDTDLIVIPSDTFIRIGEKHEQVENILAAIAKKGTPELREQVEAYQPEAEQVGVYTQAVADLVKAFQEEAELAADGVVGPNTVSKLTDVDPETKRERIVLALERLRWHPHQLGSPRVFINQPAFRAQYVVDDKAVLDMRAIVGKRSNQTSFFHDQIETVEYNPSWGIPRSILVNEYLPKLRANPAYLDQRGYEVTDRSGRQISSASVNWNAVGATPPFDVRQRPGPSNALGELKILFPNKHAIYMHDTPARNLFSRSHRAFSHGCVRLHKPREMAAAVLGKSVDYVGSKIAEGHSSDDVNRNIPVYVAYFTAWPQDDGTTGYYSDVYGRDEHLMKAIGATRGIREAAS